MQRSYRDFVLKTVQHAVELIRPITTEHGMLIDMPVESLNDTDGWKDFIDNCETEEDWLLTTQYTNNVASDGYWFAWQLFFGTVHITLAGNQHVFIPLVNRNKLTPKEHAQYIAQTLVMCLNGELVLQTASHNKGPFASRLVLDNQSPQNAGTIYSGANFPEPSKIHDYHIKHYANRLPVKPVANPTIIKHIYDLPAQDHSDDIADGLSDFSWWDAGYDDEAAESEQMSDSRWPMPSAWWLAVAAGGSWVLLFWLIYQTTLPDVIGEDATWVAITLAAGFGSTMLGMAAVERYQWLARGLRFIERFTLLPVVAFGGVVTRLVKPAVSTKERAIALTFWFTQAALSLQYFYDNATEKTTNQILTYQQMTDLYPIIWSYPVLQALAIIGFVTRRYWLLNASVVVYVAISFWASFGGIYNDNYPPLYGWQAVADGIILPAALILLGYFFYALYMLAAPVLGVAAKHSPKRRRVIAALRTPNSVSAKDKNNLLSNAL